jgi:hypothetical protein
MVKSDEAARKLGLAKSTAIVHHPLPGSYTNTFCRLAINFTAQNHSATTPTDTAALDQR